MFNSSPRLRSPSTTRVGAFERNCSLLNCRWPLAISFSIFSNSFLRRSHSATTSIFFSYITETSNRAVLRAPARLASEPSANFTVSTFASRSTAPWFFSIIPRIEGSCANTSIGTFTLGSTFNSARRFRTLTIRSCSTAISVSAARSICDSSAAG